MKRTNNWSRIVVFMLVILGMLNTYAGGFENKVYLPYLEVFGPMWVRSADIFLPIWQTNSRLFFIDARAGNSFETAHTKELEKRIGPLPNDPSHETYFVNSHLGYRHLLSENQMFGVYGSLDHIRTGRGNHFNQITVGGEYWLYNWFIGANIYKPIGKTLKFNGSPMEYIDVIGLEWTYQKTPHEKAVFGSDVEIGYELNKWVTCYVGGYYFNTKDMDSILGPKAKIELNFVLDDGRMLYIFDKFSIELKAQKDKIHGRTWLLGVNARIGYFFKDKVNLQGASRHMTDPVHRTVDVFFVPIAM